MIFVGKNQEAFTDPENDYYLDREDYESDEAYEEAVLEELEDRDYFTEQNVFWVPALARWENIKSNATLSPGAEIEIRNGKPTPTPSGRSGG